MNRGYVCPECGKRIGLMADRNGRPELYKCPYTGNVVTRAQEPVRSMDPLSVNPRGTKKVGKKHKGRSGAVEPWDIGKNMDLI